MQLTFDNRFVQELPADPIKENHRRQVHEACYSFVSPTPVSKPNLVSASLDAATLIDLSSTDIASDQFAQVFSGNQLMKGMQPHAMCYGGHQFGNWAGQLGDGRAIVLGDAVNSENERWSLQLKGAGPTPYSRTADGLAVLRSSLREYLCSEAMYYLGVPTTRALSLITTGDHVTRDMLYDGNPAPEPGAVVCRMAPSFIRFGSFQIFAARKEYDVLRRLAEHTIKYHFPHIMEQHGSGSADAVVAMFREVCELTVTMIVEWARVGFVHGVMNTDNMSIHGLTIDYGPYGWLDNYDPDWTPNTTDAGQRRYRFGQQANIALWNCYQLANALYPLIEATEPLETALEQFQHNFAQQWQSMMAAKLGLSEISVGDHTLLEELESVLVSTEIDMTRFYRALAKPDLSFASLQSDGVFYEDSVPESAQMVISSWLEKYLQRLTKETDDDQTRFEKMNRVNPKYVFRNYLAQQAIEKAEQGDYSMVEELLTVLKKPYDEQPKYNHYADKRPDWARTKVGCSMLSCSS